MKKIIFLALAGVAAVVAKKKFDQGNAEKAVWSSATDSVS